jgi:WD40 repeat protein
MLIVQGHMQLGILKGHTFPITAIAFSPDGETIISGGDETVRLWSLTGGKAIQVIQEHSANWLESAVTSIAVSPNGKYIASGGTDNTIKIRYLKQFLNANQGRTQTLTGHSQGNWLTQGVRAVAFSADGKVLASGAGDKTIKLWDTTTWQEITTLIGHSDAITSLAFSPVERTLLSAAGHTIKLWKLDTDDEISFSATFAPRVVSFDASGERFACGGLKGEFSLWKLDIREKLGTATLHSEEITSVAFSSDGQFFATGSYDKTIKLWDAKTLDLLDRFTQHSEAVYSLAFCPDSSILASGSSDKTIRLWKIL